MYEIIFTVKRSNDGYVACSPEYVSGRFDEHYNRITVSGATKVELRFNIEKELSVVFRNRCMPNTVQLHFVDEERFHHVSSEKDVNYLNEHALDDEKQHPMYNQLVALKAAAPGSRRSIKSVLIQAESLGFYSEWPDKLGNPFEDG